MNLFSFLFHNHKHSNSVFIVSLFISFSFFISGCNFNLLGGKNSEINSGYNPGLRTESLPPTISPMTDMEMDENDVVSIPFQISDPDTFLMCNAINIAARSSDHAVVDPKNMSVSGTYPDCLLSVRSSSVTASKQITITVDLFDYWTTVSSAFKLTVRRVEKPGPFRITSHEGLRKSILVNWSNADYMDGTSARYTLYYKKIADQTLQAAAFTGIMPTYQASPSTSQSTFVEVRNVRSPYWITSPDHSLEDSTIYEVYITARNGFNNKNPTVPLEHTQHVFVRTLDRYQFKVREFVASSQQEFKMPAAAGAASTAVCENNMINVPSVVSGSPLAENCIDTDRYFSQSSLGSPMHRTSVLTGSARYRVYLNGQGLMYGENP